MAIITTTHNYTLGQVGTILNTLPIAQRAIYKATAFAQIALPSFTLRGITVTITAPPKADNNRLTVFLSATKNGVTLSLPTPYVFINPPIMVPDGTLFQTTDPGGKVMFLNNYKEDLLAALQEIIVQTIEMQIT